MNHFVRISALFAALALCGASATAYRDSYRQQELGRGRHLITTSANGYNESGDAHQFAFQRAKEICPYGFDILSQDGQAVAGGGYGNDPAFALAAEKHEVSLVVQCLDPEPPAVAQAAEDEPEDEPPAASADPADADEAAEEN